MKKIIIIFIAVLFVIMTAALKNSFSINIGSKNSSTPNNVTTSAQNKSGSLEAKENNEGAVSIAVTPRSLENGSSTLDFEIALNTHSGDLSANLVAASELVDDQGNLYKPTDWEGDNPAGHHSSGVLKFNPISPRPKSLELKIKNVGGVTQRSFKWNL